jgi:hypothetical protein
MVEAGFEYVTEMEGVKYSEKENKQIIRESYGRLGND